MVTFKKKRIPPTTTTPPPLPPPQSSPPSTPATPTYAAKKSNRIPSQAIAADGDVWRECFAVVESTSDEKNLTTRTYFQSDSTGLRVWDEPPSGASSVVYASADARLMAEMQVKQHQPPLGGGAAPAVKEGQTKTSKTQWLKKWGRTKKNKSTTTTTSKTEDRPNAPTAPLPTEDTDEDLQMAIALSLGATTTDMTPSPLSSSPAVDEDLAMAMALSLSEQDAAATAGIDDDDQKPPARPLSGDGFSMVGGDVVADDGPSAVEVSSAMSSQFNSGGDDWRRSKSSLASSSSERSIPNVGGTAGAATMTVPGNFLGDHTLV